MVQGSWAEAVAESDINSTAQIALIKARRTAFIARFIVMRESKRSRSHRYIEQLEWNELASAEEVAQTIRRIFKDNGDSMEAVDRDLRRSLAHADRSLQHFVGEYCTRSTNNFVDALYDYERSNKLLFGGEQDEQPGLGGWCNPRELEIARNKRNAVSGP
ncbi:MAG: hypothetical protein GX589_06000 [Deltaproteobacteria bacterium]|nr:hypothetical protein [Deltaproteobacteria bacterium]